jgi:hypothetical protein
MVSDIIPSIAIIWIFICFLVSYLLPYKSETIEYGNLVISVVKLLDIFIILPLLAYELYLFFRMGEINIERLIFVNKFQIAYHIADSFWLFVWVKKLDIGVIAHHIITICMISCNIYFEVCLLESAFEYVVIELSGSLSMFRGVLKSYRQDNTKIMIITEALYTISFILTKILMRLVLIYFYIFKWNSSKILLYINYLLQILFYYWGYKLVSANYSKWVQGYFTYRNFNDCPWFQKLKKDD